MKQYKQKDGNYFYLKEYYSYHIINYKCHGLYTSISLNNNKNYTKGFFIMGNQYSHWKILNNEFYYFL